MALTIGVLGGSGLYDLPELLDVRAVEVSTPYGPPSDRLVMGRLGETELVFLPRHGVGHRILPSEINYRANVWALKSVGVSQIVSVSAVGSLKLEIEPGHLVFVDQFVDLTKRRASTFFGEGAVGHVPMADPVSPGVHAALVDCARTLGFTHHARGTYVCIEGPQFSTKAESNIYRGWGADVIGMTNMPEAKLAREAGVAYATIALATDYDCWHPDHDSVTVEVVMKTLSANVEKARAMIKAYAARAATEPMAAPKDSLMTPVERLSAERRAALDLILGLGPSL